MGRPNREPGDKAVALLATCLVVLGGAVASGIVLLSTGPDAQQKVWIWAGAIMAIVVVLWLMRVQSEKGDNESSALAWFWSQKAKGDDMPLVVRRRDPDPFAEPTPPPTPPTAERVREITELHSQNTWVPAKKGRKPSSDP